MVQSLKKNSFQESHNFSTGLSSFRSVEKAFYSLPSILSYLVEFLTIRPMLPLIITYKDMSPDHTSINGIPTIHMTKSFGQTFNNQKNQRQKNCGFFKSSPFNGVFQFMPTSRFWYGMQRLYIYLY